MMFDLDKAIRKIPDFPKKGILFYDITSILTNPKAFSYCVDSVVSQYFDSGIDAVACIEARGFLFAAPVALNLGLPVVLVRKKGKLPGEVLEKRFTLEYGEDIIQVHKADVKTGKNFLLLDDLIATGGTVKAAVELIEEGGARVFEICCIIGLPFLPYKELLKGYRVRTLIDYHSDRTTA